MILGLAASAYAADPLVFVGSYTDTGSKGIYSFRFQAKPGKLLLLGVAAQSTNPTFLLQHAGFLYAVNENGGPAQMGSVSAFSIEAETGKLTLLNWASSRGGSPCHLALDRTGRWMAVANHAGESIAVLPVAADGKLGNAVTYSKLQGPARSVAFSPDNRNLVVAHGGIAVYRFDEKNGALDPQSETRGPGFSRIVFHPAGGTLYALNEAASTVTAFAYAEGALDRLQSATTLPGAISGNTGAALLINAAGTFLYASNRGHDSIYTYAIDPNRHTLSPEGDFPALGENPAALAIDPSGEFLLVANQNTSDLALFKIHAKTGQFMPAGKLVKGVPRPASVLFLN